MSRRDHACMAGIGKDINFGHILCYTIVIIFGSSLLNVLDQAL